MREHLAASALALGALTLQTSGFRAEWLHGLRPDLVLLFVLATAMRHGETRGTVWGVALGFVEDTFSAGLPGLNILTKGLLGLAAGSLREQLDCDNPNSQALVAASATLAQGLAHLALLEVFSAGRGFVETFLVSVAPAAAVNGALLPAAAHVSRLLARRSRLPAAAAGSA